jgi:hypothetical protein
VHRAGRGSQPADPIRKRADAPAREALEMAGGVIDAVLMIFVRGDDTASPSLQSDGQMRRPWTTFSKIGGNITSS